MYDRLWSYFTMFIFNNEPWWWVALLHVLIRLNFFFYIWRVISSRHIAYNMSRWLFRYWNFKHRLVLSMLTENRRSIWVYFCFWNQRFKEGLFLDWKFLHQLFAFDLCSYIKLSFKFHLLPNKYKNESLG